jgi:hypothetical protein
MNIASILRHWFTLAATLVTAWIVGLLALDADQQAELAKAFGDLVGPLVIIGTLIITAAWRIALTWAGNTFRRGAGEENGEKKSGPSGGAGLLLLMTCTAAVLGGLPSCSLSGVPVTASVELPEGKLSYSAKGGINMEYRPGYGEMPDAYRNSPSWSRHSNK